MKKTLKIASFFFFVTLSLFAQTESNVVTITGRELIGKVENGESIREVIGDVVLTQGNVVITCDKAIQYLAQNSAKLIGNVIITQDTLTITTPEGFYYGNEKRAFSDKGVKLNDRKVILTAKVGEYFFNEHLAKFNKNVKLYDTLSTLTSNKLHYFRAENRAVAVGEVNIVDIENIIYSDSLIHFRDSQITHAFDNVAIKSRENNTIIFGDRLEDYRIKNYTVIDKNPLLIQIDTSKNAEDSSITIDTMVIKSLKMESFRDSSNRFVATDSVEILRKDFASKNDYTIFFRNEDYIVIPKLADTTRTPVMWFEQSQLSGDSIFIYLTENKIHKLEVKFNALIISQNELRKNRYDQITGEKVIMYFEDNQLKKTEVFENILSIYFLYEEEEPNGLIKASAKDAVMYFADKQIEEVRLYGDPKSDYYPENLVDGKERSFLLPKFIVYDNLPLMPEFMKTIRKEFNFGAN